MYFNSPNSLEDVEAIMVMERGWLVDVVGIGANIG